MDSNSKRYKLLWRYDGNDKIRIKKPAQSVGLKHFKANRAELIGTIQKERRTNYEIQ